MVPSPPDQIRAQPSIAALRDQAIVDLAFYRVKRAEMLSQPETAGFVPAWDRLIADASDRLAGLASMFPEARL